MKLPRIILHIDMNSYFASVEQQANPFWRGRSVGVCSYLSPRGCLIASSMEAKARGIRTGCRVQEARRLDPRIVLVENEPAKYRSVTAAISQILNRYTDRVEPYSIDESFLDLTGWAKDYQEADNMSTASFPLLLNNRPAHRALGFVLPGIMMRLPSLSAMEPLAAPLGFEWLPTLLVLK